MEDYEEVQQQNPDYENIAAPPITKSQISRLSRKPSTQVKMIDETSDVQAIVQQAQQLPNTNPTSLSSNDGKGSVIMTAETLESKLKAYDSISNIRKGDGKKLEPTEREQQRVAARQEMGIFDKEIAPKPEGKGAEKLRPWVTLNKPIVKPEFPKLPLIENLKSSESKKLLLEKLKWCRVTYDFHSAAPDHQTQSKKNKLDTLVEINKLVTKEHSKLDKQIYENTLVMVSINLFRNLPRLPMHTDPRGWNPEEDMAPKDPAWMHLKPTYDILFNLLNGKSFKAELARKFMDVRFAKALLHNLCANDVEERAKTKLCFHRIYSHFGKYRRKLLPELINLVMQHMYEGESFLGIKEALELLGTIVTGFLVPLRKENIQLLNRVFLPLHKCNSLPAFHQPLTYTISQYSIKQPNFTKDITHWLIVNWPKCRNKREILFFKSLEEVLQITPPHIFEQIYTWLCVHLAQCISSPNSQVSAKALEMWNSDYFAALVSTHPAQIIRIYAPHVIQTAESHWQKDNRDCASSLIDIFNGMNEKAFEQMVKQAAEKKRRKSRHSEKISRSLEKLSEQYPPPPKSERGVLSQEKSKKNKSNKKKGK